MAKTCVAHCLSDLKIAALCCPSYAQRAARAFRAPFQATSQLSGVTDLLQGYGLRREWVLWMFMDPTLKSPVQRTKDLNVIRNIFVSTFTNEYTTYRMEITVEVNKNRI